MGIVSALAKMPLSTTALGLAGAGVVAPVLQKMNPLNESNDSTLTAVRDELQARESNRLRMLRAARLQRNMAVNTARLARLDPHTYNEILAGRRLPRGSVVFGGTPRTDLMELAALKMSTGEYTAPEE